jgi:hypothetical protein
MAVSILRRKNARPADPAPRPSIQHNDAAGVSKYTRDPRDKPANRHNKKAGTRTARLFLSHFKSFGKPAESVIQPTISVPENQ